MLNKKSRICPPFASPDLLYLLNPVAQKSWFINLRGLAKRVPADEFTLRMVAMQKN